MVKILIMDDEAALRNIVYNMIKPLGHALFTAEDGHQAVELGKQEVPDLALLDMRVPDMDGLEVMAELKKINPNIRCIMLSGFGDVDTAVSTIKMGAFDYVSKPFKIDEVLKVVNKAIESLGQSSGAPAVTQAPAATAVSVPAAAPVPAAEPVKAVAPTQAPVKELKQAKKNGLSKGMLAAAGGVLAAAVLGLAVFLGLSGKGAVKEYGIPYTNPTGLCSIKNEIWVTDWVMGNVYRHSADGKLSIAAVYKIGNAQPTGIAYDGESLWTCNSSERRIYRHRMDDLLTVEAIFATSGNNPSGLYFDGANLWVLDSDAAKIYKHKLDEALSVVAVYDSPALHPCGMFREGEFFYIGDYKTSNIYKVSMKDLSISEVYKVPFSEKEHHRLVGITWDGKNVWATAEGIGEIFQFPLSALKSVKF